MQKFALKDFTFAIEALLRNDDAKAVTIFASPLDNVKQRVRAMRKGKDQIVITFGPVNYAEREFLALCKKAKTKPRRCWFKLKPKPRNKKK